MNPLFLEEKKFVTVLLSLTGGFFLVVGGILMFTNPNSIKYEKFATEELVKYAKENICPAKSANLEEAIKSQVCNVLIDTGKNKIPKLIASNTLRGNYLLFSIYRTNLYLYQFETIGIFNNFYVIGADKVYDQQ